MPMFNRVNNGLDMSLRPLAKKRPLNYYKKFIFYKKNFLSRATETFKQAQAGMSRALLRPDFRPLALKRFGAIAIIAAMLGQAPLALVAHAFFEVNIVSISNTFDTATPAGSVTPAGNDFTPTEALNNLKSGESVQRDIIALNSGMVPLKLHLTASRFSGDSQFYNDLQLDIKNVSTTLYSGLLKDVDFSGPLLGVGQEQQLTLQLTLPLSSTVEGKTTLARFHFELEQWNTFGLPSVWKVDAGTMDTTITASDVKINEVFPSSVLSKEFVELYNPTGASVDVTGWTITDDNTSDVLPSGVIAPRGFAVIVTGNTTVSGIATAATIITLPSLTIGNGLAESGDRVVLRKPGGEKVDSMSYGSNTTELNPAVLAPGSGHSVARHPKGFDTDQATDWEILPVPNPGTNPHGDVFTYLPESFWVDPPMDASDASDPTASATTADTPADSATAAAVSDPTQDITSSADNSPAASTPPPIASAADSNISQDTPPLQTPDTTIAPTDSNSQVAPADNSSDSQPAAAAAAPDASGDSQGGGNE